MPKPTSLLIKALYNPIFKLYSQNEILIPKSRKTTSKEITSALVLPSKKYCFLSTEFLNTNNLILSLLLVKN